MPIYQLGDLENYLTKKYTFPLNEKVMKDYILQLCHALKEIHEKNM
jgi:serine/threonine protein kinase